MTYDGPTGREGVPMIETSGHDPLCKLSQPCDDETPEHGYCGFSAPRFCIHCQTWCICEELQIVKQQAIRDYSAAVEAEMTATEERAAKHTA